LKLKIHVADRDEVLAHQGPGVAATHAPDTDGREVDGIAGGLKPAPEHVPRHDGDGRASAGGGLDEFASGYVAHDVVLPWAGLKPAPREVKASGALRFYCVPE
jgi:hypothetical protein